MEHGSIISKVIEAGLEGDTKKVFCYADLLWHRLPECDSTKVLIENRLSGAYHSQKKLRTVNSHYGKREKHNR